MSLDSVIAELEGLRRLGGTPSDATLERWRDELAKTQAAEGKKWLSEDRAIRRGRRSLVWFRARFDAWLATGYARWDGRKREYHEAVVPVVLGGERLDDPIEQARKDAAA